MTFQLLFFANLAAALVALIRLRPTLFIFASNMALASRALENIRIAGQPISQAFLAASVFSHGNISIAFNIFAIGTAVILIATIVSPRRKPGRVIQLPPARKWVLTFVLVYFAVITLAVKSFFTTSTGDVEGRQVFEFNLGGVHVILWAILLHELLRRVRAGSLSPLRGILATLLVCFLSSYLHGSTGFVTGIMVAAIFVFAYPDEPVRKRLITTLVPLLAVISIAYVIRGVREDFAGRGVVAINDFVDEAESAENSRERTGEGAENTSNATQTATHALECINLYENHISREWRSIYDPITYTFEPSFLLEPLGITRPKEAAWELADYYIHGGGINILGEFYWNGGYLCVALMMSLLALFAYLCDTRYLTSRNWLILLLCFAPGFLMAFGYGFAQVARGIFDGVLMLIVDRILFRVPVKRVAVPTARLRPESSLAQT